MTGISHVAGILKETIALCAPGASVREICSKADQRMEEETGKAFKKDKKVLKGIAFPCCVSVNSCICHYSPLNSEADVTLKDGDMVKLDLGAHIDGFIAVVAHTLVVGASKENKVKGRMADCLMAAHLASEAALRLVKPGNEVRIAGPNGVSWVVALLFFRMNFSIARPVTHPRLEGAWPVK